MLAMLRHMAMCGGLTYSPKEDRTLRALERRGLVEHHAKRKYGKNSWHLTTAGKAEANTE